MSFISSASSNSKYRGYDYYISNKIKNIIKINDVEYEADALGSNNNKYKVHIDLEHHKKNSLCTCPNAENNKIMCKHKVALYFSIFPDEAKKYIEEVERQEREHEEYVEDMYDSLADIVNTMKKDDLKTALLDILYESPEWLCERFVTEYENK